MAFSKGNGPVSAGYARGGPEITTRSRFMKTPNQFTSGTDVPQDYNKSGKGGKLSKIEGETKKLPTVKPRT